MRALGIILAGGNNHKMRELTSRRAVAAMPIAGSYRAIDFTLSNMEESREDYMYSLLPSRLIMATGTEGRQMRSIRTWIF